jgi:hypothetical protein
MQPFLLWRVVLGISAEVLVIKIVLRDIQTAQGYEDDVNPNQVLIFNGVVY